MEVSWRTQVFSDDFIVSCQSSTCQVVRTCGPFCKLELDGIVAATATGEMGENLARRTRCRRMGPNIGSNRCIRSVGRGKSISRLYCERLIYNSHLFIVSLQRLLSPSAIRGAPQDLQDLLKHIKNIAGNRAASLGNPAESASDEVLQDLKTCLGSLREGLAQTNALGQVSVGKSPRTKGIPDSYVILI